MRNLKKFLALVLAMLMICSVAMVSTSAAEADVADYKYAATQLQGLTIMKGDENGNLMLENGVTRWQAALFFVQALTGKTDAAVWNAEKTSAIFSDVPEYGTAIDYAYGIKLILGRGNGVYGYADPITYQDMLVMAVRALGYETADMSYPYGYILAAQKLGLTETIEDNQMDFKAKLNRGETAQIIWNMLGTDMAVTDPLNNDKILYPDDLSTLDTIRGNETPTIPARESLMQKAGYTSGEFFALIDAFNDTDEEDEIDTVTVKLMNKDTHADVDTIEIAAADLGIDFETARQADYVGKYMTILVDETEDDFLAGYNIDPEESDANVVIATLQPTTTVNNVAAANIKYDANKNVLTLGSEKFNLEKYEDVIGIDVEDFTYTTKDGYTADSDRYVVAEYFVEERKVDEDTTNKYLHVATTPVEFVQYVERTIKSNETGKDEKFVLTATLGDEYVNFDGETTVWVEETLNGTRVTENTTALSKRNGNASMTVTVEGEDVKSGDFVFMAYNDVDNVMTIVKNVGTLKTGRLTAQSSKETVKIDGTYYEFGFAAERDGLTAYDRDAVAGYIAGLEAGKDNVQFILSDGKIVYLAACGDVASDETTFPFVIIDMAENGRPNLETLADLLDKKEIKESELTDGWYLVDGAVAVPVMDTKTGEWKLAYVKSVAKADTYVEEDEDFTDVYAIASLATTLDSIGTLSERNQAKYDVIEAAFATGPIFAAVDEADGVYTITEAADFVTFATIPEGLLFTDSSAKTNYITADPEDEDGKRVTLTENTVIIAVDANGVVMSRKGVQVAKYSLEGSADFYSADASLIVLKTAEDLTNTTRLEGKWSKGSAISQSAEYYIVLDNEGAEYEVDADDTFTLTVYNVFNVATLKVVDKITMTGDVGDINVEDFTAADALPAGTVLVLEDGAITFCEDELTAVLEAVNEDYTGFDMVDLAENGAVFKNADTLYGVPGNMTNKPLDAVNVKVVTLDLTGLDEKEYDFTDLVLDADYYEEDGVTPAFKNATEVAFGERTVVAYELSGDMVEEIAEPTEGVFDQFIIDTLGISVLIHTTETSFEDCTEDDLAEILPGYVGASMYDEDNNALNMVVYKLLYNAADFAG